MCTCVASVHAQVKVFSNWFVVVVTIVLISWTWEVCLCSRRVCDAVPAAALSNASASERARGLHLPAGTRAPRPPGQARWTAVTGRDFARRTQYASQLSDLGCRRCNDASCSDSQHFGAAGAAKQTPATYKKCSNARRQCWWYATLDRLFVSVIVRWLIIKATLPSLWILHNIGLPLPSVYLPSVLWHCWLGVRKSIRPVAIEWWGVVVWSEVQIVCIWYSWCHCHHKAHYLLSHLNPD